MRDTFYSRPSKHDLEAKEEKFDDFVEQIQHEASETELTDEAQEQRRAYIAAAESAAEEERRWVKTYFPGIFSLDWNAAHLYISRAREGHHTVSGFRKSGKTAYTMVAKIIRPMVEGAGGMHAVNLRTQDKAENRCQMLYRMIDRNRLVQHDYDITVEQQLKSHYIINGTHLIAGSMRVGLRSLVDEDFNRLQVAVNDDLYDRTTVSSELDNSRVVEFVTSEVYGQMEDGGLVITLGNSITDDCPIVRLKEQNPDAHFSLPALDEHGESTWPAYRTTEEWQEAKEDIPADVWAGDYMDDPLVLGDILDPDWLRTINVSLIDIIHSISAVDPARGSSPSACRKGAVTLGLTSSDDVVMLDVYSRKESWGACFYWLDRTRQRSPHHSVILFEDDFAQWDLAEPYYKVWREQTQKTLPFMLIRTDELVTATRGQSKVQRILNLVHPHQVGRFAYDARLEGSEDHAQYVREYKSFGEVTEGLDTLDACATAFIKLNRMGAHQSGEVKATKERTFQRPEWGGSFR